MLKKFVSMTVAGLLLITGLSIIGSTSANASNTDASLNILSTINGAYVGSIGTPDIGVLDAVAGSICFTSAQAARTSPGAYPTLISGNGVGSFVPIQRKYDTPADVMGGPMAGSIIDSTTTFIADNLIGVVVDAGPLPGPNAVYLWHFFLVSIDNCPAPTNEQVAAIAAAEAAALAAAQAAALAAAATTTPNSAEIAAAVQAAIAAAIVMAKTTLHGSLQGDKPGTLDQYRAADYKVNNEKVVAKVNAAVLKLPLVDRENAEKIAAIIKVENFVDLVSTPATQKRVTSKALVELGLVAADNPNKTTIANALKKSDATSLNSIEKIQEAIKAELGAVKERKDLLAQIRAKITARKR